MKDSYRDPIFKIIFILLLISISLQLSFEAMDWYNKEYNPEKCQSGIIKERIMTVEPTNDPSITMSVQYYLIECSNGRTQRIKTDRNFPIGTEIKRSWSR